MTILDIILERERERLGGDSAKGASHEELERLGKRVDDLKSAAACTTEQRLDYRFRVVRTTKELEELVAELMANDIITFDIETTGVDPFRDKLVGLGFCTNSDYGWYIPVGHRQSIPQLPLDVVLDALKPVLEAKLINAHNGKFEYKFLKQHGIELKIGFDTQVAYALTDETGSQGLKPVAQKLLGVANWGLDLKAKNAAARPINEVANYCVRDCLHTHGLMEYLKPIVERDYSFLFNEVELPLVPVVAEMELNGVPVDTAYLEQIRGEVDERRAELVVQIHELAGKEFNLNSQKQVAEILFDNLGLEAGELTPTGLPSTSASSLRATARKSPHPIIELILENKGFEKLKSSYLNPELSESTGRLHPEYLQTGGITGRMSGKGGMHPRTLPNDGVHPYSIRRAIKGALGWSVLCSDFAGQEPRITASEAKDDAMKSVFADGVSIHGYVAKLVFGLDCGANEVKKLHKNEYEQAKAIGLGLVYGKGAWKLAKDFTQLLGRDVSEEEAQKFIDNYFSEFPGVKKWLDKVVKFVRRHGYVEDMAGRRRRFKYINKKLKKGDKEGWKKQQAEEREAKNFMVQGFAATVTKRAMVRCHERLKDKHPCVQMIASRHDEIIFLVPNDELDDVCAIIKVAMEKDPELEARGLDVPMLVEITYGENWSEEFQKPWEPARVFKLKDRRLGSKPRQKRKKPKKSEQRPKATAKTKRR